MRIPYICHCMTLTHCCRSFSTQRFWLQFPFNHPSLTLFYFDKAILHTSVTWQVLLQPLRIKHWTLKELDLQAYLLLTKSWDLTFKICFNLIIWLDIPKYSIVYFTWNKKPHTLRTSERKSYLAVSSWFFCILILKPFTINFYLLISLLLSLIFCISFSLASQALLWVFIIDSIELYVSTLDSVFAIFIVCFLLNIAMLVHYVSIIILKYLYTHTLFTVTDFSVHETGLTLWYSWYVLQ